jgi:NADPH-dependent ferric siderophore reductase
MNVVSELFKAMRPALKQWRLIVRDAEQVTPRVRRLRFTAPDLHDMTWVPGQDLVLNFPEAPRRHYTIRALCDDVLTMDFVLHGHGVAAQWAKGARPGDRLDAAGPRGRTRLSGAANWHLFVGDETCIPAIFAMIETLPNGARAWAFLEVESDAEKQSVTTAGELRVEWIVRNAPARPNTLLLNRLKSFQPPAGAGHAYVVGETSGVRAQRHWLLANGWSKERITSEGYWRPGRAGGHDHA